MSQRAFHIILKSLINAENNTMSRVDIEKLLSETKFASTANSHAIAYCNDMRKYAHAVISYVKTSKYVTHVVLHNAAMFDAETLVKREIVLADFAMNDDLLLLDSDFDSITDETTVSKSLVLAA